MTVNHLLGWSSPEQLLLSTESSCFSVVKGTVYSVLGPDSSVSVSWDSKSNLNHLSPVWPAQQYTVTGSTRRSADIIIVVMKT